MLTTTVRQQLDQLNRVHDVDSPLRPFLDSVADLLDSGVSWEGTPDSIADKGAPPDGFAIVAHWSAAHDGVNVEIDAPDGMPLTVHVNDWRAVNLTVGTDQPADGDVVLDPDGSHSVVCACGQCQEWEPA